MDPTTEPILIRLRAALDALYGGRLERVVLYGSRARGDARPDSDWDVAVFIRASESFGEDSTRLARITTDILMDTGEVISAMPLIAGSWRDRTGFMHEVRKDGVDL